MSTVSLERVQEFPAVGVSHYKENLQLLDEGMTVTLTREPSNPWDKNAVVISTQSGQVLGYLPREIAARVPDAYFPVTAEITRCLEYDNQVAGLRMRVLHDA